MLRDLIRLIGCLVVGERGSLVQTKEEIMNDMEIYIESPFHSNYNHLKSLLYAPLLLL